MKAVRIKIHMDSDTLTLSSPELKPFVGKNVEVIVLEEPSGAEQTSPTTGYGFMRGTVVRDDVDPFGPVTS
jgi:hypothetical protein